MKAVTMIGAAIYDVLREEPSNRVSLQTWVVRDVADSTTNTQRLEGRVFYQEALRSMERRFEGE
jgi:hypothetical protein